MFAPGLPRYIAVNDKFEVPLLRLTAVIYNLHRGYSMQYFTERIIIIALLAVNLEAWRSAGDICAYLGTKAMHLFFHMSEVINLATVKCTF